MLTGGRSVEVPAPANQIPLFIRAGAVRPLLPADVQTLSDYGSGVVHLSDRRDERALLAWPEHGRSSTAAPTADARVSSSLQGDGSWVLQVRQRRSRTFDLQVALQRRPCALLVNGKRHKFSYGDGVLRAAVKLKHGAVEARSTC